MGVVTVTIDDDVEERFRDKLEEMDAGKGAMGEAVSEALESWIEEKNDEKKEWVKIMEEGIDLGGEDFPSDRGELHER